jgi:gluconate kinase
MKKNDKKIAKKRVARRKYHFQLPMNYKSQAARREEKRQDDLMDRKDRIINW